MRAASTIAALSASVIVFAQAQNTTFSINPAEVSLPTRATWCQGEISTCDILCDHSSTANDCDPNTLTFHCTCQNNTAPGLQYYLQTIYTFSCQQAYSDCIASSGGVLATQTNCTNTIQKNCGTLDPAKYVAAASSSSSSASASATATSSGAKSSASAAASSATSKAAAPTAMVQSVANGAAALAVGAVGAMVYML